MSLRFTKMHGLGNDFMVIDAINQSVTLSPGQIITLANRHTGIGFDQCLIIEKSKQATVDFFYRIFNANGEEVGQCGNGARCVARFIQHYGLSDKQTLRVATKTTELGLTINKDDTVTVDMGLPNWEPKKIPLDFDEQADSYALQLNETSEENSATTLTAHNFSAVAPEIERAELTGSSMSTRDELQQRRKFKCAECTYRIHALSVGNPHAVILVNDLNTIDINTVGKAINEHPLFPEQCNAGFMELIDTKHIKLRVYERGCGETLACGSAAVAAAAVGIRYYKLEKQVRVSLLGGDLIIDWPSEDSHLLMTGPASFVYDGVLHSCA